MKFTLTIPKDQIIKTRDHVIDHLVQDTTIKGFRKGKAPRQTIISQVGETKIMEETVNHLLPQAYTQEVKAQKIKPVTYPKFKPVSVDKDKDWQFEVEVAQQPEIKLGDYKTAIKGALAKEKLWTPGKDLETPSKDHQGHDHDHQDDQKEKIDLVFSTLLNTCQLEVPQMLLDDEVNRMLSDLLDQVTKLGMSIDDYLQARNQTKDSIRKLYTKQSEESLKLEFILQAITEDLGISVTDQELVHNLPQSAQNKPLTPEQKVNLKLLLSRRQTIDRLLALGS